MHVRHASAWRCSHRAVQLHVTSTAACNRHQEHASMHVEQHQCNNQYCLDKLMPEGSEPITGQQVPCTAASKVAACKQIVNQGRQPHSALIDHGSSVQDSPLGCAAYHAQSSACVEQQSARFRIAAAARQQRWGMCCSTMASTAHQSRCNLRR